MRFDEFITPDPLFDLTLGVDPDNSPDTQIVFVVYRGHETNWGTLSAIMPGSFAVQDSDVANETPFETEVICVCDAEDDAKRIVAEKNALLGPDDVQYKYHGEFFFNGLYAGFDMSQLETLAVILDVVDEYTIPVFEPVYVFQNKEMIMAKLEDKAKKLENTCWTAFETVSFVPYVPAIDRNRWS